MKYGQQRERRARLDEALAILCDGLAPAIYEARHRDIRSYVRVQTSDGDIITADDFRDAGRRTRRQKLDRARLTDPHQILKLLAESRSIRVKLLSADEVWLRHLEVLSKARNCWAHFKPVSVRQVNRALDSAEQLLRAIGDDDAAQEIATLRWRGRTNWPKDAA